MPVPKKRHSNTRTRTRRANWKLTLQNLSECPQCHSKVMPHHACRVCGTYKGRMVLKIEAEEKGKPSAAKSKESKKEEKPKP